MATKAFMQSPNVKHVPFLGDKAPRQRNPLKHVSTLPTNNNSFVSSKRLGITSSSSSVMAPQISSSSSSSFSSSIATTAIPTTTTSTSVSHAPSCSDSAASATIPLSKIWREIQGCSNWENLIDPLHPLLQQEITRYGNLVSACYKAFDLDPKSKRYLNCKYGKKTLLQQAGIKKSDNYQVTKYIYATPDINIRINPIQGETNPARWIGYVAVSSDESVKRLGRRDIVVTFRGTVTNPEWIANFMSSLTPARLDPHNPRPEVKVESGFLSLYTSDESQSKFGLESCRQQLLSEISRLMNTYRGEEMSITLAGHSMGSSLAHLLAYDIAELGLNRRKSRTGGENVTTPVTVFSFAGPRVGNLGFKERCQELGVKVLRIANVNDPITKLPGVVFNEGFGVLGGKYELPWSCSCYAHVGVELALDYFDVQNPSRVHDLETYINLLNRPRRSLRSASSSDDNVVVEFFRRTGRTMFSKQRSTQWKMAATSVVNLLGSVSNQMMYYNLL